MRPSHATARRSPLPLLLLGLLALAPARTTAAQDSSLAPPASASLLRRVAEAIDAQRDNRPVWVVIQSAFPHTLLGVYHSALQARQARGTRAGYALMGPFVTPPDSGTQTLMLAILPCPGRHDSYSNCPDTTRNTNSASAAGAIAVDDADSIVVTIYGKRGFVLHRAFAPDELDAMFLTLSAIDKFAIPYYTRLYGPAIAARMREQYLDQIRGTH